MVVPCGLGRRRLAVAGIARGGIDRDGLDQNLFRARRLAWGSADREGGFGFRVRRGGLQTHHTSAGPLLLEGFVELRRQGRLDDAADGVRAHPIGLRQGQTGFSPAVTPDELLFLGIREPTGGHGRSMSSRPL
jgi:hypothetical protein